MTLGALSTRTESELRTNTLFAAAPSPAASVASLAWMAAGPGQPILARLLSDSALVARPLKRTLRSWAVSRYRSPARVRLVLAG